MSEIRIVLTCASWEDRFRLGFERNLTAEHADRAIVYFYDKFASWTQANRDTVKALCAAKQVEFFEKELFVDDPAVNWRQLQADVAQLVGENAQVRVDISTMPRELIWTAFWSLETIVATVRYIYHLPSQYNSEWLSRDPGRPRLVYKLSGVSQLSRRTALVVVTGYDSQRTGQLIRFYEPATTLVGLQIGDMNKGNHDRMQEQRKQFGGDSSIQVFDVDAFAPDHGLNVLGQKIQGILASHNVIVSSLGPKLSAVSLYQLHRRHPEIGIAYAPSGEFNRDYSSGIGQTFTGQL